MAEGRSRRDWGDAGTKVATPLTSASDLQPCGAREVGRGRLVPAPHRRDGARVVASHQSVRAARRSATTPAQVRRGGLRHAAAVATAAAADVGRCARAVKPRRRHPTRLPACPPLPVRTESGLTTACHGMPSAPPGPSRTHTVRRCQWRRPTPRRPAHPPLPLSGGEIDDWGMRAATPIGARSHRHPRTPAAAPLHRHAHPLPSTALLPTPTPQVPAQYTPSETAGDRLAGTHPTGATPHPTRGAGSSAGSVQNTTFWHADAIMAYLGFHCRRRCGRRGAATCHAQGVRGTTKASTREKSEQRERKSMFEKG